MTQFTGRTFVPEHLDDPDVDPEILARSLRFIRMVNARLGGTSAALGHVRRWTRSWPRQRPLRVLDVGTGTADIPLALLRWGRRSGFDVRVTAVDNHAQTLEFARRHLREAGEGGADGRIALVDLDARRLMDRFAPEDFDIVHAGMFLHHLPDVEIVTMLRIMDRLAACGLIWNDLSRDPLSAVAVRLLTLGLPALVRHDAVVSVAKGFRRGEALDLARRAGIAGATFHRHLCGRFTLTVLRADGSGRSSGSGACSSAP